MEVYLLTDKEISKLQGTSDSPNLGLLEVPISYLTMIESQSS